MTLTSAAWGALRAQTRTFCAAKGVVHLQSLPSINRHARFISSTPYWKKSKSSFASEPAPSTPGDVPVINTKGKGSKGASKGSRGTKSKRGDKEESIKDDASRYSTSTENTNLPGEKYQEEALQANMQRAVQRCRETISQKVSSHGRADPGACPLFFWGGAA